MRTKIVAGNWKMNNDKKGTAALIGALQQNGNSTARVIIAPAFTHLSQSVALTADTYLEVAAQNMHQETSGAFTGEIAAPMLQSSYGHSRKRRTYFNETDAALAEKRPWTTIWKSFFASEKYSKIAKPTAILKW